MCPAAAVQAKTKGERRRQGPGAAPGNSCALPKPGACSSESGILTAKRLQAKEKLQALTLEKGLLQERNRLLEIALDHASASEVNQANPQPRIQSSSGATLMSSLRRPAVNTTTTELLPAVSCTKNRSLL